MPKHHRDHHGRRRSSSGSKCAGPVKGCCENIVNSTLPKNEDGTLKLKPFHYYLPKKRYRKEMEMYADLDVLFGKLKYNSFFNRNAESLVLRGGHISKSSLFPTHQLKIVWGDDSQEDEINAYRIIVLLVLVRYALMEHQSCEEVPSPAYVITDIHGQFSDLLQWFFKIGGPEQQPANLVCCGDMVDRGCQQLETVCLFLYYKLKFPTRVFILRGNHEDFELHETYGFFSHINERFAEYALTNGHRQLAKNVWYMFVHVFDYLPVACVIEKKIFAVHAGLSPALTSCRGCFSPSSSSRGSVMRVCLKHKTQLNSDALIDFINGKVKRPIQIGNNYIGLDQVKNLGMLRSIDSYPYVFSDLVWSDPMSPVSYHMQSGDSNWRQFQGWKFNHDRMISLLFGTDAIEKFNHQFQISCTVRGHEPKMHGYEWHYLKRCITVFSAPNYTQSNKAAIVLITETPSSTNNRERKLRIDPIIL